MAMASRPGATGPQQNRAFDDILSGSAMTTLQWADVIANPSLQDLPFKIELNRWGRIELSPASNPRGLVQFEVGQELSQRPGGRVLTECSIQTTDGVRVADVAWVSDARLAEFGGSTPYPRAPELCVEVMSPANTWADMHRKAALYLEAGADEVWVVTLDQQRQVFHR
jgi:Uma2 family endonuclease